MISKGFTLPYWFVGLLLLVFVLGAESLVQPQTELSILLQEKSPSEYSCNTTDCILLLEALTKSNPTYIDAYIGLAINYWQMGNVDKMYFYLNEAHRLDPVNHQLFNLKQRL